MDKNTYRCTVCGYIYVGDEAPENCPVCGATKEFFELYNVNQPDAQEEESTVTEIDPSIKEVLIIGGGIAGLSAAETLRELSDTVQITLVTNEEQLPYYRLNLTRYLAGEISEGDLSIHDQYWYDDKRIKVLIKRVVVELNTKKKEVLLFDGTKLSYDKLIMTLGAHPFVPPIEGATLEHVISIRSIDDIKTLDPYGSGRCRIMVIGGGVLGLETAVAFRKKGCQVTVAEGAPWLMPRQLNATASTYVEGLLKEMSIDVFFDYKAQRITKTKQGLKIIDSTESSDVYDYVILATGVRPNTYIARRAQLEVDRGVIVNNFMRTSDPDVYAAGDITEHYGIAYGLWHIAQYQGKIAAMNLLGNHVSFGGVPRSNSLKVLNIDLFSIGEIRCFDGSYSLVEHIGKSDYLGFIIHDQQLAGAIAIGYKNRINDIKDAVDKGRFLTPEQLLSANSILDALSYD